MQDELFVRTGWAKVANVMILADIEGSSGCWSYRASAFKTDAWARACLEMTRDLDAVARALLDRGGAGRVVIQDFHRTGYNILPEYIDHRAEVRSGYRSGPVPGIGHPGGSRRLMLVGMHAASGTEGFLAHTLTSRLAAVLVNGRPVSEAELFAAALAPYRLRPVFFSGCPLSCRQAEDVFPGLATYALDKSRPRDSFNADSWRKGLAQKAVEALGVSKARVPVLEGPITSEIVFRSPDQARRISTAWKIDRRGRSLVLQAADMADLYRQLVTICYITPFVQRLMPLSLYLANIRGYLGLAWVRRRLKATGLL